MKKQFRQLFRLVICLIFFISCAKQEALIVESPKGDIKFSINNLDRLSYNVDYHRVRVIENGGLGFILDNGEAFKTNLKCYDYKTTTVNESYETILGKRKTVTNQYNELIISLEEKGTEKRRLHLQVRAYDDGIAFRYIFPEQLAMDSIVIIDECTTFAFTKNEEAYYLTRPHYDTNYEGLYTVSSLNAVPVTLIGLPILMKYSDSLWTAITEANLTDYAGMYLVRDQGITPKLISSLSPYPGKNGIKVLGKTPFKTPWRVIMIADNPGRLIESDIILNLNEPCKIDDTSWIKPGKSTWHWWHGTSLKNVDFESGMDYQTMIHYIEFCARNGIEYHSLVEYKGPWYEDPDRKGWEPGSTSDVTKPRPELQMERLLKYAKEKGVGMRLWVHWKALNKQMEEAFKLYHEWGIKGLMVDFMDRDDQEMVNFYHTCLQKAAKYQLLIQFHGAYKPTGIRRTYPILQTTEAVLNTEWRRVCNPDHNLIVPFTRMLAGPMDYHLGGFRSVTKDEPLINNVNGTRCHHMAMYVVYESYLQLVCDYPSAYEGQPGFEFIKQVPTVWDDIKVINGKPGEYITIARKSGEDWYIGSMTNWKGRSIDIPLCFLPEGVFYAKTYSDAENSDTDPNNLEMMVMQVTNTDTIHARLASGGGFVMYLRTNSVDD